MTAKVRAAVRRRARGRCEYCRIPFRHDPLPFEVDHVIAEKHEGGSSMSNLAAACAQCNAHKGSNIAGIDPSSGALVRLYNPRTDRWPAHFRFEGAAIVGVTAEGRATVQVLAMNKPDRLAARAALIDEGAF